MNTTRFLVRQPPRRQRRLGRLCVASVAGAVLAGSAGEAAAVVRISQDVDRTKEERPTSQNPLWINQKDCRENNDLVFRITLSGHQSSETLSVWASEATDCTQYVNRDSDGPCRRILAVSNLEPTMEIIVPAKDVAAALGAVDCKFTDARPSTAAAPVTIYFLRQASLQEDGSDHDTWTETKVDLSGPKPPSNVKAGAGDGRLIVSFNQNEDQDVRGYILFCDANAPRSSGTASTGASSGSASSGGAGDGSGGASSDGAASGSGGAGGGSAGTTGDSGGDGGETAPEGDPECYSRALIPGEIPDTKYQCGKVGRTGSGSASDLRNGDSYVVGVAAYDLLGNVGELSELACGTPVDVDGFFELYREAGGQAGGGFCSVGGPVGAARWVSLPLGVVAASAALGLWRRSRRRSGRPSLEEHE